MSGIDLLAVLYMAVERERQWRRDNEPCPQCGGDRLRGRYTPGEDCHMPRPEHPTQKDLR